MKQFIILFVYISLIPSLSCKKFVYIDAPTTSLAGNITYESNASAAAVLTGIYSNLSTNGTFAGGPSSIGYLCGNSADELTNYSHGSVSYSFYANSYTSNFTAFWGPIYQQIYVSNAAIEGLSNSHGVSPSLKSQLLGEAKFMRAFLHFYATNLFGDIPLITTTNYQTNNVAHRIPSTKVYQQIISDLLDAQGLLGDGFFDPSGNSTTERIRPNKGAVASLLARVYLYEQKWDSAELEASNVISNMAFYTLDSLDAVFLKNSTETIWSLQSIQPNYNTADGQYYILTAPPGSGRFTVAVSPQLINAFETGDHRVSHWIGTYTNSGQTYYYPYKYKNGTYTTSPPTEYEVVFRLSEQHLIRAEARARQGNFSGAIEDLNMIRNRAGLANTSATSQVDILNAVFHERQVELFTEWGHRWFDLKRTDSVNPIMSIVVPQKGGTWNSYKELFPIPLSEISLNSNLTQNPGYTN